MLNITKATIMCREGHYNWAAPSEIQWSLSLTYWVDGERFVISDTFPEEPDWEGETPEVVLELLEDRVKSYLFASKREETLEKIEALKESMESLLEAWARTRIHQLQSRVDDLNEEIENLQDYL